MKKAFCLACFEKLGRDQKELIKGVFGFLCGCQRRCMVAEVMFFGLHREELKNTLNVLRFLGFKLKSYTKGR